MKSRSIGGTAKSVDYHAMILLVDLWKICATFSEKLEADSSWYSTSVILEYFEWNIIKYNQHL